MVIELLWWIPTLWNRWKNLISNPNILLY
jgi:hypothetical protein